MKHPLKILKKQLLSSSLCREGEGEGSSVEICFEVEVKKKNSERGEFKVLEFELNVCRVRTCPKILFLNESRHNSMLWSGLLL